MTIEQTLKMLVNALEECHKGLLSSAATGRPLLPAYLDRVTPAVGNAIEAGRAALAQMAKPVAAAQAKCSTCGAVKGTRHDKHCPHAGTLVRASETAAVPERPMTLGEQVRDAQRAVSGWSSQKRDSVQLEGEGIQRSPAAQAAKPESRCKLGCTASCKAREHGCASECPALPWQPAQAAKPEQRQSDEDAAFLAARLRRLFKHFDVPTPDADDNGLIGITGSLIGMLLTKLEAAPQQAPAQRLTNEQITAAWERFKREDDSWSPWPHIMLARWVESAMPAQTAGDAQDAALPAVLFDGYAVLQALTPQAQRRTSGENVADTLDAVVRLIRAQIKEQP